MKPKKIDIDISLPEIPGENEMLDFFIKNISQDMISDIDEMMEKTVESILNNKEPDLRGLFN
ncbi:hypothetical protein [Flavobacterium sp. WC2509]|uniref:hypothetical protein n=1 Tax=Flavobacterium sp. WC2509 TaxID=3461406 RepID=UPI004043ED4B